MQPCRWTVQIWLEIEQKPFTEKWYVEGPHTLDTEGLALLVRLVGDRIKRSALTGHISGLWFDKGEK